MQRSYAAALFTTLLLSMGLTACGGEEHEKAIDKVAEAEELAKANAPKVTLDEPATIQADPAEQQESDTQKDTNQEGTDKDAETQKTDTQEKEAEKSDNTDATASAEKEESNGSAEESSEDNKAEEKAN